MERLCKQEQSLVRDLDEIKKIEKDLRQSLEKAESSWEKYVIDRARKESDLKHRVKEREILEKDLLSAKDRLSELEEAIPDIISMDLSRMEDICNMNIEKEIAKLERELEDLSSIDLPIQPPELSEKDISAANKKAECYSRYLECQGISQDIMSDMSGLASIFPEISHMGSEDVSRIIKSLSEDLLNLKSARDTHSFYAQELEKKKNMLDLIQQKMDKLGEDPVGTREAVAKEVEELTESISKAKIAEHFRSVITDLSRISISHSEIEKEMAGLSKLLELCEKTQHEIMDMRLAAVNDALYSLSSTILEGESEIRLVCHRDIKSNNSKKAIVNLEVYSGGVLCDGIKSLSGGERARACICLLLALHQHTPFPFMFFDETMASIGSSLKSIILEELKRDFLYADKGVLFVMHDGVRGVFDEEIDLEDGCCSGDRQRF